MRLLFDTNVVFYWLSGYQGFKVSLQKTLGDLRRKKAVKLISAVTVQEIEVWARHSGDLDVVRSFLESQFATPLIFDKTCAQEAARLASLAPRDRGATKSEDRSLTDRWHRDASIAGTAHKHGLDALLTANHKDFAPFVEHMSCELLTLVES